jgi:hypothetical protein
VRKGSKLEQDLQPFRGRKTPIVLARGRFSLAESSEPGDDGLHDFYFIL